MKTWFWLPTFTPKIPKELRANLTVDDSNNCSPIDYQITMIKIMPRSTYDQSLLIGCRTQLLSVIEDYFLPIKNHHETSVAIISNQLSIISPYWPLTINQRFTIIDIHWFKLLSCWVPPPSAHNFRRVHALEAQSYTHISQILSSSNGCGSLVVVNGWTRGFQLFNMVSKNGLTGLWFSMMSIMVDYGLFNVV